MDESKKDLETLREETQPQGRLVDDATSKRESESSVSEQRGGDAGDGTSDGETRQEDLVNAIEEELAEIEQEDRHKTVSVWDGEMAALLAVLEEQPAEMQHVDEALREQLGIASSDTTDRSEVVRLLLRVGLQEATPEVMAALEDAMRRRVTQTL